MLIVTKGEKEKTLTAFAFRDHQQKKAMSGVLNVPRYYLNVLSKSDAKCRVWMGP